MYFSNSPPHWITLVQVKWYVHVLKFNFQVWPHRSFVRLHFPESSAVNRKTLCFHHGGSRGEDAPCVRRLEQQQRRRGRGGSEEVSGGRVGQQASRFGSVRFGSVCMETVQLAGLGSSSDQKPPKIQKYPVFDIEMMLIVSNGRWSFSFLSHSGEICRKPWENLCHCWQFHFTTTARSWVTLICSFVKLKQ